MIRGYEKPLFIQPFDHRESFQTKLFGWKGGLTAEQTAEVIAAKLVIYDGFQAAIAGGVSKEHAGILVDEQFGAAVLCDAARHGYITACPVEKSGQKEFDFEYGEDFTRHIEAFNPTFSKVLVRYNPEGDAEMNRRQCARLKRLSDYLHGSNRLFLFELLVPAEPAQLERFGGDKIAYDRELRPPLTVRTLRELQDAGVEPDVWKVEGMAGPTVLGRSSDKNVRKLLEAHGYEVHFVEGEDPPPMHQAFANTLDTCHVKIRAIQPRHASRAAAVRMQRTGRLSFCGLPKAGRGQRKSMACRWKGRSGRIKCRCPTSRTIRSISRCWNSGCAATSRRSCSTKPAGSCRSCPP
jgi:myo-inositol catabolism protein IolC